MERADEIVQAFDDTDIKRSESEDTEPESDPERKPPLKRDPVTGRFLPGQRKRQWKKDLIATRRLNSAKPSKLQKQKDAIEGARLKAMVREVAPRPPPPEERSRRSNGPGDVESDNEATNQRGQAQHEQRLARLRRDFDRHFSY